MKLSGSISALCLDREMLLGEACGGETAKYLFGYLKLLKINLEIHVDFAPSCFSVVSHLMAHVDRWDNYSQQQFSICVTCVLKRVFKYPN